MKAETITRLALAAAALAAATVGARAEEGVAIKNLLGSIGIVAPEKEAIPYRERAPLVMPPKMELREPKAPGEARANVQWPNDPDVAAKRRKEADARAPVTQSETRRMSGNNPTLSPDELRKGRRAGAGLQDGGTAAHRSDRDGVWINPDELRAQGRVQGAEDTLADGTPVRRVLTDPPTEFNRSATGRPIEKSFEPQIKADEADPRAFIRQQAGR